MREGDVGGGGSAGWGGSVGGGGPVGTAGTIRGGVWGGSRGGNRSTGVLEGDWGGENSGGANSGWANRGGANRSVAGAAHGVDWRGGVALLALGGGLIKGSRLVNSPANSAAKSAAKSPSAACWEERPLSSGLSQGGLGIRPNPPPPPPSRAGLGQGGLRPTPGRAGGVCGGCSPKLRSPKLGVSGACSGRCGCASSISCCAL